MFIFSMFYFSIGASIAYVPFLGNNRFGVAGILFFAVALPRQLSKVVQNVKLHN